MFKRILIPLDGSDLAERVLPHAIALAKSNQAEFFLLRVVDPIGAETRPRVVDPLDWNFRMVEAEGYLKGIAAGLAEQGLDVQSEVREGRAADIIIEYAHEHKMDLVLLSSHGKSGISGWNVSSVVQKVILRIRTSVMLIRAYQPVSAEEYLSYHKILLPLDGSQRAETVLGLASQLARSQDAELLVVHIIRPPDMPRQKPLSHEDIQLADQIIERNRLEAQAYLEELRSRFDIPLQTSLYVGQNVASELRRIIDELSADLVLLTAHGSTGDTGLPYGSLVITTIAYGTTPLLIFQDMAPENIQPTQAEEISREQGRR